MSANPHTIPFESNRPAERSDDIARHLSGLQYPLKMNFKKLSFSDQASVTDASGKVVLYTKQKLFKFREHVEIFTHKNRQVRLADIRANKVIDWSARYDAVDTSGQAIGTVGRRGWRSIWKAHYEVFNPGDTVPDFSIQEENPIVKVLDSLLGGLPIIGMFTGYFFHPRYLAQNPSGQPAMRLSKKAAFWEGRFDIEKLTDMTAREELNLILSFMMLVMLERKRG